MASPLLQAAADGDLGLFKRIASSLDAGKGCLREAVEAVWNRGAGALHLVAGRGRMKVCTYLVEELHVDVDAADESGDTPLAYAVRGGCVETVRYLLGHDANPDKANNKGSTSLHFAAALVLVVYVTLEGSKAYNRKDYATAVKLYSMAANHCPDDATLYSNRSLCWLKMGEGERALLDAQVCRLKRPDWAKACYLHGAALMLLKDYGKACDAFLDGVKLDPANAEIQNALREAVNCLKRSCGTK